VTLTAKDVAEISRLLAESDFDELTLELDGLTLSLRRNGAAAPLGPAGPDTAATPPAQASRPEAAPAADGSSAAEGSSAAGPAAAAATQSVIAPLLGTFYRAPKPGAPPFVEVGSVVEEDTIVGIIEVMKLMNTVRAGTRGTVADIVAKDGALVEYGETLMRLSKGSQP
jgi:acetyl-CoA carboxylase biotin carboxyl carrier protein